MELKGIIFLDSRRKINGYFVRSYSCSECGSIKEIPASQLKKRETLLCHPCTSKTEVYKDNFRGKTPPNFQIKCIVPCEYCNKNQLRTKRDQYLYVHTWCNTSCQNKWQHSNTDFNKGNKNPGYVHGHRIGGKHAEYGDEFTIGLRKIIRARDNYTCQKCNLPSLRTLEVHHIDTDKHNNDPSNLISLCKVCHRDVHWELIRASKEVA